MTTVPRPWLVVLLVYHIGEGDERQEMSTHTRRPERKRAASGPRSRRRPNRTARRSALALRIAHGQLEVVEDLLPAGVADGDDDVRIRLGEVGGHRPLDESGG